MPLDIGIVGAGYAGTAAALFLARDGHRVTLYEEADPPRAVGAGILLQPTGLRALDELGLFEAVLAQGARVDRVYCRTPRGRTVLDLSYANYVPSWFGVGMHRGTLLLLLHERARAAGIPLLAGVSVRGLGRARGRVHPTLADGTALGEHELLLVADGARSELLGHAEGLRRAREYPWGALWFVAEDPEHRYAGELFQVAEGSERLLGFLPSGIGPAGGRPLVSLFWSVRLDRIEAVRERPIDDWKRDVLAVDPGAARVLEQVRDHGDLLAASYLDVVMDRYHADRIVFLGDAAHAMSPQLGQGCNLALEDARVLAACLRRESSLARALELYSASRREHIGYYQFASRALTPLFQSDRRELALLRDALLGAICRLPVSRDLMLATLAGVQCDLFGPTLPLDSIHALLGRAR